MLKGRLRTLSFLVVLSFAIVGLVVYFLYNRSKEVRALETHKEVLIDRLAEEVFQRRRLERENDSLKKLLDEQPDKVITTEYKVKL